MKIDINEFSKYIFTNSRTNSRTNNIQYKTHWKPQLREPQIQKIGEQKYCIICKSPIYDKDSLYCSNSCRKVGSRMCMFNIVRKRRCALCGKKNDGTFHIHHIDKNRDNNTFRNLTLLCQYHHYIVHSHHVYPELFYKIARVMRKIRYNKDVFYAIQNISKRECELTLSLMTPIYPTLQANYTLKY